MKNASFFQIALVVLVGVSSLPAQPPAPTQPKAQHEANFEAERKQANDLFVAGKTLESLPLYEDLCRQDQTIAVFAERHGVGLIFKAARMADGPDKTAVINHGIVELRRAQSLGDNSPVVQTMLSEAAKTPLGAMISGVSLTVGYTYQGTPAAQAKLRQAETAFQSQDFKTAAALYQQAAALDPAWYTPPLYTGDMYFRMKDTDNAVIWLQKAIDIDPDRDTAYRYWGDVLYRAGDPAKAKLKYEQAIVAEPYSRPGWAALQQWVTVTHTQVLPFQITRPAFATVDGKFQVDPALSVETGDGHASWSVYQQVRIVQGANAQKKFAFDSDANGHTSPAGPRHTLAEEVECINVLLADVQRKLDAGTVTRETLEPSLKNLFALKKDGMLECWILLSENDFQIRFDYANYRKQHRELLAAYLDRYVYVVSTSSPSSR